MIAAGRRARAADASRSSRRVMSPLGDALPQLGRRLRIVPEELRRGRRRAPCSSASASPTDRQMAAGPGRAAVRGRRRGPSPCTRATSAGRGPYPSRLSACSTRSSSVSGEAGSARRGRSAACTGGQRRRPSVHASTTSAARPAARRRTVGQVLSHHIRRVAAEIVVTTLRLPCLPAPPSGTEAIGQVDRRGHGNGHGHRRHLGLGHGGDNDRADRTRTPAAAPADRPGSPNGSPSRRTSSDAQAPRGERDRRCRPSRPARLMRMASCSNVPLRPSPSDTTT